MNSTSVPASLPVLAAPLSVTDRLKKTNRQIDRLTKTDIQTDRQIDKDKQTDRQKRSAGIGYSSWSLLIVLFYFVPQENLTAKVNLRRWFGYILVLYYNSYFVQNWYIGGHMVATIVFRFRLSKMNKTTLVVDSISDFECYKIEEQTCLWKFRFDYQTPQTGNTPQTQDCSRHKSAPNM